MKTLLALFVGLALTLGAFAGEEVKSPEALPVPPGVEDPNWLENGSIWSYGWYDANGDWGTGVRLSYDISEVLTARFDYLFEEFDFNQASFEESGELTVSMKYKFDFLGEKFVPYAVGGAGTSNLDSFNWQYLIGGGVEYKFESFKLFAEFLHLKTDSQTDRNEFRIGAGIPLSSIGGLFDLF